MTNPGTPRKTLLVSLALLLVATLVPAQSAPEKVSLIEAEIEVPYDELVDVGIVVFRNGLPPESDDPEAETKLEEKGIYRDVRAAEARYFPVHLAKALELSGQWGAVRVVPAPTDAVDLVVSGTILTSTGRELGIDVQAIDSSGSVWLEKRYKRKADPAGYALDRDEDVEPVDPFGSLYNEIANDLLAARMRLSGEEIQTLRSVSQIRFAADLAPHAFRGYLEQNRKGETELAKLPAEGDPMFDRVAAIRERDYLLVDTFHDQYLTFYSEMSNSYSEWRSYSYEEEVALAKLKKQSRMQKLVGILAIAGGILADSNSRGERVAREGAVIGGQIVLQQGLAKGREAKIHRAAVQELAASFDSEVSDMVLEVEGRTLRLAGTAEAQYGEWRDLLREIWAGETGGSLDPNDPTLAVAEESFEE